MAVKIELKRSAVPGKIPTTSSLELGELAINTYDGKVYFKKDVSGIQSIIEITSTSGSVVSSSYANYANQAGSSSYALNSTSASYATNAGSANTSISASYALSASYASTASSANNFIVRNSLTASGLNYPTVDGSYEFQVLQTDAVGNLSFSDVLTTYDTVYNAEATTLIKGTPVYISGSQGANPKVYRADAANPSKMPVVYVISEAITAGSTGRGITLGEIDGIDLTGYTSGTSVYVAAGGGWTSTRPTGSTVTIQFLGLVTKEGTGGKGLILNPGPASLPNIQSGYVWVGDSNSYPTSISTSSLLVLTASYSTNANLLDNRDSTTFANTGSNSFVGNQNISGSVAITGSLVTTGTITAQTLNVQQVTSSIIYSSGSNVFGNSISNTQVMTGSIQVTGSSHYILGNVGIGTTSPLGILHTSGDGATGQIYIDQYGTAGANLLLRSSRGTQSVPTASQGGDLLGSIGVRGYGTTAFSSGGKAGIYMYAAENFTDTAQGAFLILSTTPAGSTSRTERIRIVDSGNVGIGTTSPSTKLEVNTSDLNSIFVTNPDTSGTTTGSGIGFKAYNGTSVTQYAGIFLTSNTWSFGTYLANQLSVGSDGTGGLALRSANSAPILFFTGGASAGVSTERMTITSGGNVGIGTSSPGAQLEVSSTTGGILRLKRDDTSVTTDESLGTLEFYTNDGDGPHIASYIRGLGADLPGQNYGRFGALSFGVSKTANQNAVEAMRIDLSGNVGIGTTSPGYTLDVNGTGRFSNNLNVLKTTPGNVASFSSEATLAGEYTGVSIAARTQSGVDWYSSEIRNINVNSTPGYLNPRLGFFTQNPETYLPADRTEKLSILSNGSVGIGTTSPGDILDVQKNQNATTQFYFRNTDTTNTSSRAYLNVIAGTSNLTLAALNGGDTYIAGTSGKDMYFQQNIGGIVNMIIKSTGNVGIGTTSALQTLTLAGKQMMYNTSGDGGTNVVIGSITSQVRSYGTSIADNSFASIQFTTDATTWYKGNIRFLVNGSDGTASAGTEAMRITSGGNKLSTSGRTSNAHTLGNMQEWVGEISTLNNGANISLFNIANIYDILCGEINVFFSIGQYQAYTTRFMLGYSVASSLQLTSTIVNPSGGWGISAGGTLYNETLFMSNSTGTNANTVRVCVKVWGYAVGSGVSIGGTDLITSSYLTRIT